MILSSFLFLFLCMTCIQLLKNRINMLGLHAVLVHIAIKLICWIVWAQLSSFSLGSTMWFQSSEGLSVLNVQDRHFTWLAVDAGCWLGAYLGLVTSEPAHGSPWGLGFLQPGGWVPNGEVSRAFKRKKAKQLPG